LDIFWVWVTNLKYKPDAYAASSGLTDFVKKKNIKNVLIIYYHIFFLYFILNNLIWLIKSSELPNGNLTQKTIIPIVANGITSKTTGDVTTALQSTLSV
jgi:hypothetical protein